MELVILALAVVCGIAGLAGSIWIGIIAIQNGDTVMGIISIFCGIVALVYGFQHLDQCKIPLGLLALGIAGNLVTRALTLAG